jgi:hypothetical protein
MFKYIMMNEDEILQDGMGETKEYSTDITCNTCCRFDEVMRSITEYNCVAESNGFVLDYHSQ